MLETKADLRTGALKLLAKREYSSVEFEKKLSQKFPERKEEIEALRIEFAEKGWLSDQRMAEAFIHDQVLLRSQGPLRILEKLKAKGVDAELAKEKLRECFPESERMALARSLAQKKYAELRRKGKDKDDFTIQAKVKNFLFQKGFSATEVSERDER